MVTIDNLERALEVEMLDVVHFDTATVIFVEERVATISSAGASMFAVYCYEHRRDYLNHEIHHQSTYHTFTDALNAAGEYHSLDIGGAQSLSSTGA
jgi:hypothetical protein